MCSAIKHIRVYDKINKLIGFVNFDYECTRIFQMFSIYVNVVILTNLIYLKTVSRAHFKPLN